MNVTDVSNQSNTPTTTATKSNKDSMSMDKEDFLKLFLESLKNQDPMSPMENSDMMAQLSQLGQMEAVSNLSLTVNEMKNSLLGSQIQQGSSMLGKQVTAFDSEGAVVSGKITELSVNQGMIEFLIGNKTVQMGQIAKVTN